MRAWRSAALRLTSRVLGTMRLTASSWCMGLLVSVVWLLWASGRCVDNGGGWRRVSGCERGSPGPRRAARCTAPPRAWHGPRGRSVRAGNPPRRPAAASSRGRSRGRPARPARCPRRSRRTSRRPAAAAPGRSRSAARSGSASGAMRRQASDEPAAGYGPVPRVQALGEGQLVDERVSHERVAPVDEDVRCRATRTTLPGWKSPCTKRVRHPTRVDLREPPRQVRDEGGRAPAARAGLERSPPTGRRPTRPRSAWSGAVRSGTPIARSSSVRCTRPLLQPGELLHHRLQRRSPRVVVRCAGGLAP